MKAQLTHWKVGHRMPAWAGEQVLGETASWHPKEGLEQALEKKQLSLLLTFFNPKIHKILFSTPGS